LGGGDLALKGVEQAYEAFIQRHLRARKGERLRKLRDDHGYGEKLLLVNAWWPAVGNFEHLHPEYEVRDFKNGLRYLDVALVRGIVKIGFEAVGFGPHAQRVSRWRFSDNLLRDNYLQLDGWRIFYFSVDLLEQQPMVCQQMIQQIMGRYFGDPGPQIKLSAHERDVLRFALSADEAITPGQVRAFLSCGIKYARATLHRLMEAGILAASGGTERIRSYSVKVRNPEWYL